MRFLKGDRAGASSLVGKEINNILRLDKYGAVLIKRTLKKKTTYADILYDNLG